MPTNNQEKWAEEFDKKFVYKILHDDSRHAIHCFAHDAPASGGEIKSFLRQEIRQAKIETWEECKKLHDQDLLYTEMEDAIQEAIKNLQKQNEQTNHPSLP